MSSPNTTRRQLLKTASGLLLLPTAPLLANKAMAEGTDVVVGTWGGDYQNLLLKIVNPVSGVPVVFDTGSAEARLTKLRTEVNARRGSMDVALLQDLDMYDASQSGTLEALSDKTIPNLVHVHDQFKTAYSIPHIFSAMVLVYNKEKISTPPQSFNDALDPKYRSRVGFSDILFAASTLFAGLANGGNMGSYDAGTQFLSKLKQNDPKVFPSNEAVAAAFKSGEIWISCMWKARALQWQNDGLPLGFVVPQEGAVAVTFEGAVPKSSRNKEGAAKFLNAMLDPKGQVEFARAMGYAPTVRNADLPADLRARVCFTDDEMKRVFAYDAKKLITQKSVVLDYWNKSFKA